MNDGDGRLNQPGRWVVVGVEVLLAAAAVLGAVLVWRGAGTTIGFPLGDGRSVVSTRLYGDDAGIAVGLGVLAGFLVLDALRQAVLAGRPGRRGKEPGELARYQRMLADEQAHRSEPIVGEDGRHARRRQ